MSSNSRKKIMVFVDWFEPGFKAGGPIRSCVNFVHHMKQENDLFIFTSDRDLGDTTAYPDIQTDCWLPYEQHVHIFYASPASLRFHAIRQEMKNIAADFIYLNSMFSVNFSVIPLLVWKFNSLSSAVILSPRGMLKSSALRFKPLKKKIFLQLFRAWGMSKRIRWHATDETEAHDIRKQFGAGSAIHLIANFPGFQHPFLPVAEKRPGELKLIFIGRIHPIKNLDFLLRILSALPEKIYLSVVAPVEDEAYWSACQKIIESLPANIQVRHTGELPHHLVLSTIREHHAFVLPTRGENFGHAIFEALSAGRPVVISNQTPWRNLEDKQVGWDLPLDEPAAFVGAIRRLAGMDKQELDNWCIQAWKFCQGVVNNDSVKNQYLKLFS